MLYKLTIEGDYLEKLGTKEKHLVKYKEDFEVDMTPEQSETNHGLSMVKNHLLYLRLKEKKKDFTGYRTYALSNIEPVKEDKRKKDPSQTDIKDMDTEQLAQFAANNSLYTKVQLIASIVEQRKKGRSRIHRKTITRLG